MSSIFKIPPEIFPLIASYISLQLLPATLSALSLTASTIRLHVNPVLYSSVVLTNEEHASQLLEWVLTDIKMGDLIRELHLRIDLSTIRLKRRRRNTTTVLVKLQEAIEKGHLAHMSFFRLVLLKFRYSDNDGELKLNARYSLPRQFWTVLKKYCPLLRGLCVDGVGDSPEDPWLNEPEFYDMKDFVGLKTLSLKFKDESPIEECTERLPCSIVNVASSLQSLTLFFAGRAQDVTPLFSTTFPCLTSISLSGIKVFLNTPEVAMKFWTRHPKLERINVETDQRSRWFSDRIEHGLFPGLTHLRAPFEDIRALATHLRQLEHLCVAESYNCQVPYLLRCVLPDGLPNLRSLEIHQMPSQEDYVCCTEGAMWHETEGGQLVVEKMRKRAYRNIDRSFIHSVVKGAPNLKQLCLQGFPFFIDQLKQISPILTHLKLLEHFYYRPFPLYHKEIKPAEMDEFLLKCRILGESCSLLKTVTDVGFYPLGAYLVGNIVRDGKGSVHEVVPGRGFGMESTEGVNDPFPLSISPY